MGAKLSGGGGGRFNVEQNSEIFFGNQFRPYADLLIRGASAGALNVARRGLGTGNRTTIEKFARQITVRTLS